MTSDLGLRSELIDATPGEPASVVVDVTNHLSTASQFQVRVVGAAAEWAGVPHLTSVLEPGARTAVELTVVLPLGFPTGEHLLGVECVPIGSDGAPSTDQQLRRVADLTVSVGSLAGLHAVLEPRNVTGRGRPMLSRLDPRSYRRGMRPTRRPRNGRATVSLRNRSYEPIRVSLSATSPGDEVSVSFDQTEAVIEPGHIVGVRTKVRAARPFWGRTRRRPFTVIARSTGHQIYLEGSHSQAALIRPGALKGVGILTVLALWASTLALVYNRVIQDDGPSQETAEQAGAEGEGDGSGDGSGSGQGGDEAGGGGADGESAARDLAVSAAPVEASGQVTAREPQGVRVRIRSVSLVEEMSPDATFVSSPRSATHRGVKLLGRRGGVIHNRIVPAEVSTTTDNEGRWAVAGLTGPGFFEIRFTKPGYATRAYVVEMPEDGTPISLDTDLVAGDGAMSGTVLGPGGPLGNVDITVTDGTLTFATTTPTTGAVGSWTVDGLTTPGTYLVTARRRGYATATELVRLSGGQTLSGVNLQMAEGTGTILGTVRSSAGLLGDVTITATNGEVERTTTSLTQGPVGSFSLPELPRPGVYTLTVAAEGWLTQTMEVNLTGDEATVGINMVARTGIAYGQVTDTNGAPLGGIGITAVSEDHTYKNTTAPDGRFELVGLEPGSYVIEFASFEHHTGSSLITIASGALREINIQLSPRDTLEPPPNNSLTFSFSAEGEISVTERTTGLTASTGGGASASFVNLPAGVRTFDITGVGFQPATVQFRMGLNGPFSTSVTLKPLVVVNFKVEARQGGPIVGAAVTIRRNDIFACPETNTTPGCQPFVGETDLDGVARDEDGDVPELTDGQWVAAVEIVNYALGTITFNTNYDTSPSIEVILPVDKLPELTLNIVEPQLESSGAYSFDPVADVDLTLHGFAIDGTEVTMTNWTSGGTGVHTLQGIPPGDYSVEMRKAGYRNGTFPEQGTLQLRLNDERVEEPVLVRIPDATAGRVVWDRGGTPQPVEGAIVTVHGIRTVNAGPSPVDGTWTAPATEADGVFTFAGDEGPIFGEATIEITHPDFHDYDEDGDPGTLNTITAATYLGDVELQPLMGDITQRVDLDFGEGVASNIGANIRLEITAAPPDEDSYTVGTVLTPSYVEFTGATSYAEFRLIETYPGDYQFEAYYLPGPGDLHRFTPEPVTGIYLPPNRSIDPDIVSLVAQARISGRVWWTADPSGMGQTGSLDGATIELRHAGGGTVTLTEGTNPVVLGDGEYDYAFVALDAGNYELVVSREGYTTYLLDAQNPPAVIPLGAGQGRVHDLHLRPLASISFSVAGERFDGDPLDVPGDIDLTVVQPDNPGTVTVEFDDDLDEYVVTGLDAFAAAGYVRIDIGATSGFEPVTIVLSDNPGDDPNGTPHGVGLDWGEHRDLGTFTLTELPGTIALDLESSGDGIDLSQPQHQLEITLFDENGNEVATTFTHAGGVWTTGDLQPGNYRLHINAHNHAPLDLPEGSGTWIIVQRGDPTPVTATLFSGRSTITGTVTLTAGSTPLTDRSGVLIELLDDSNPPVPVLDDNNQPIRALSSAAGTFTISGVEDGDYHLRASNAGFTGYQTTSTFHVDPYEENQTRVFDFGDQVGNIALTAINRDIQVRVISAVGGTNVVGALVQLVPDPQYSPDNPAVTTNADTTDSNGVADFTGVIPGRYLVEVDSANSTGHHLDFLPGTALHIPIQAAVLPQVQVFIQEARITGTVTIAGGPSLNGSTVSVYTIPPGGPEVLFRTFEFSGLESNDQSEEFSMYVPPGVLRVVAEGPTSGYLSATRTFTATVGVPFNIVPSPMQIIAAVSANISIREFGTNTTITGATVTWIRDEGGTGTVADSADGSSDGTITLTGLLPGTYEFRVAANNQAGYQSASIDDIDLSEAGGHINITLHPIATGRLRVNLAPGSGGSGSNYTVRLTPGASGTSNSVHNLTPSSRVINGVRTGSYTVEVCRGATFDGNGNCPAANAYGTGTATVNRNALTQINVTVVVPTPPTTTTTPTTTPTTAP